MHSTDKVFLLYDNPSVQVAKVVGGDSLETWSDEDGRGLYFDEPAADALRCSLRSDSALTVRSLTCVQAPNGSKAQPKCLALRR